ncbi:hypothetical protein TNCV_3379161 [Trichonephila clavipes]|nr:hypothetical protein TNCV_3379161 [Trichonephila clavipes]
MGRSDAANRKCWQEWMKNGRFQCHDGRDRRRAKADLEDILIVRSAVKVPDSTATAGSDVVQSGRPIIDDFFQHLWPYIGNNTANAVFQMVKRLWLIRIDQ